MIEKIIKIQGTDKSICILIEDDQKRFFVIYGAIGQINIESKKEYTEYSYGVIPDIKTSQIVIPLIENQGKFFYMMQIKDSKSFEDICSVVDSLI